MSPPVYTVCHRRQNVLLTRKHPSAVKEVPASGLSAWHVQQRTDKWHIPNKQNDEKRAIHNWSKLSFLVWNQIRITREKLGESDQGSLSVGDFYLVSVKIKPLFWTCSCSLPSRTPDSFFYSCYVLAQCDTQLHLHLFQNINDNNYNNTRTHMHAHTRTFSKPTSSHVRFEPVGA